jgi:hypothetical protein
MIRLARARVVGALALTAVLVSVQARAQVPLTGNDLAAVLQWMAGLEEYLMIREQAAGTVPLPRTSPDLPQVLEARTALASAIRDRRAGAKIGDLFTFEVRRTFRKLIARSIIAHEVVMSDLLAAVRRQIGPGSFRLAVNQPFPQQLAAAPPSCVLDLLPPLPWELDYRIADHDLVLIDLGSGLVIDILPDALPHLVTGGTVKAPGAEVVSSRVTARQRK